jgi:rRNA maturation protein Nop10
MPIYRTFRTHCPHCHWKGRVGFGDLRLGPRKLEDGSLFYTELACPNCGKQVHNPLPSDDSSPAVIGAGLLDLLKKFRPR